MAFRKITWPLQRHLQPKVDFNKDKGLIVDLFLAHDRVSGPLFAEFKRQAEEIDNNPDLTPSGKVKARAKLVTTFRETPDLLRHKGAVEKGRARAAELLAQLTKPRTPDVSKLSVFEQVDLANTRDRTLRRFESLEPSARRAAFNAALETRNTELLGALLREPALLNEGDAKRATAVIMATADPQSYRELTELKGKLDLVSGEFDPATSAVEVAAYSLDGVLQHADEWAGLSRQVEEARARFAEMLKTPNAPIVLSDAEGRDPAIYRTARTLAQENGRILSIAGPDGEVEASMTPPANGGGNGAS
jgi:hypothetical protein